MCRFQCVRNLGGEVKQRVEFERLTLDARPQRVTLQQLHGDERLALVFIDVVDGADIGMI